MPHPRSRALSHGTRTAAAGTAAAAAAAALVAAPAIAAPVDNGSMASVTDQSSLAGTSLDQNDPNSSLGSIGSLTSVLGGSSQIVDGSVQSLSSLASTGLADGSLSNGSLASLGCALGSTGVTGSGSIGSAGGINHSVPWLNGQTGALPSVDGATEAIDHITGPASTSDAVGRFNVLGTDLGIMWDDGTGTTMLAFGDTIGAADDPICNGLTANWRSNVLLRSDDTHLSDGMSIDSAALASPGQAKEILPSLKQPGIEFTVIPTAGISVPNDDTENGYRQYIDFMSVKDWGAPGEWTTNYSALAYSDDGGENWITPSFGMITKLNPANAVPTGQAAIDSVRMNTGGNANFQMGAFVRDHTENEDDPDSYIYMFGTPSGRNGSAKLARVQQKNIGHTSDYQYWDGSAWSGDVNDAAVVLGGKVSELSVGYNEYLDKYIAMYTTPFRGLVVRTSDHLTGGWSGTHTLIGPAQVPSLYGGFMHPASNASGSSELYFVATTWSDYNVMLLRTDLSKLPD